MKNQIALFAAAALLIGCSSVSNKIPTVKIEKRKAKATVQNVNYVTQTPNYVAQTASTATKATPKEAAALCETDVMRNKVVDGNDDNDSVRIMVVQDNAGSSQLLSEIEINCRDYFLRKSIQTSQPTLVRASTNTSPVVTRTQSRTLNSGYTYIVQRGDTVWEIAREHCTTVKAITRLNGLGQGNVIDVGQRLNMPVQSCG